MRKADEVGGREGNRDCEELMSKKKTRERSGSEPIRDYRAVGARARCAFTRALNTVNALSGTTSLLSPASTIE